MALDTAEECLIAYGYVLNPDGRYRIPGKLTQVWEKTDGGWFRYEGMQNEEKEVYRIAEKYRGLAGVTKQEHPEMFDWVYPNERLIKTYGNAVRAREQS